MSILIVAEAGINHDGDLDNAFLLVDEAKRAGADAVKFQMFSAKRLKRPELAMYQLEADEMGQLQSYCHSLGIEFMCTPFSVDDLVAIEPLLKRIKIASGCIRNVGLLEAARMTGKPVIVSTGMSTQEEIAQAVRFVAATLLHCTSAYPCPLPDVNLRAMSVLSAFFGRPVGYSDHTKGITVPIAAAAMGATVIEKHLTLDCRAPGPDHAASIEPDDFRVMVSAIRDVEIALGDGVKRVMPSEAALRKVWA